MERSEIRGPRIPLRSMRATTRSGPRGLCPEKTSAFDAKGHAFAAAERCNRPVQFRGPRAESCRSMIFFRKPVPTFRDHALWAGAVAAGCFLLAGLLAASAAATDIAVE